ncbi:helix-turn-helix domain-containing protein [Mucilaginibacter terrae]|uniref:helix-turn-helix domain-containing protein n=1 Tax=Mucilaginibacter terrae TaxID=1955052 RepID=UPI00363A5348
MEVICLEEPAFYALLEKAVERLQGNLKKEDEWIAGDEAMQLLRITSKATLQKYRDEGKISFTYASARVILYERASILAFLKNNKQNPF